MELLRIKSMAKAKGWSMSHLCGMLGLANSYFTDVKNGKNTISADRLAVIADLLDTTPEYLKGETDVKEKPTAQGEGEGELQDLIEMLKQADPETVDLVRTLLQKFRDQTKTQ